MDFHSDKPIYLQIADVLCEDILSGKLPEEGRIPSVREYGADIGVNPNTVMRVYEKLTADEIIYNKRGIGYFVCSGARARVLEAQKADFIEKDVPAIKRRMELLGLDSSIFN
jgi:DNA-binding transcriptional regulator YhcF (GntR family)